MRFHSVSPCRTNSTVPIISDNPFPEEHPVKSVLRTAPGLLITEPRIHQEVLVHFLMGEQTYLVVSPPRCFAFREFDQRATNALPVKTWVHRDVIQKQVVGLRDQYQNAG